LAHSRPVKRIVIDNEDLKGSVWAAVIWTHVVQCLIQNPKEGNSTFAHRDFMVMKKTRLFPKWVRRSRARSLRSKPQYPDT
jgi:hypothetical protein